MNYLSRLAQAVRTNKPFHVYPIFVASKNQSFSLSPEVFTEVKIPPRVGWDGVVSQILDSATDGKYIYPLTS